MGYSVPNYKEPGSTRWVIGGAIDVISGGELDIESGGAFKIGGTQVTATAAQLNFNYNVTAGTVAANKAIVVDSNLDAASVRRLTASQWFRESGTERVVSTISATESPTTGWTALAAYGISELSCTNSTANKIPLGFILPHPGVAGVHKIINAALCSTNLVARVEVESSSAQWIGSATGSTGKTYHRMQFNDAHELIHLYSASAVHWLVLSNQGSVALSTNAST